jgi:hypothetical protein
MKAKSRRRLLVSSIAMLLVAMIALGTATFAWFTVDTDTKANGLQVKTSKQSTLEISSNKLDWTSGTLNYAFNSTLKPASSYDGVNWYYAAAKNGGDDYSATDGHKVDMTVDTSQSPRYKAAADYVFYDQLNIRNAGAAAVNNVTIKFTISETPANSGNYLRVAVVPADQAGTAGKVADTAKFKANNYDDGCGIYGVITGDKAKPVDHVGDDTAADSGAITAAASDVTVKNGSTEVTVNVGNLVAATATSGTNQKNYMLFVWFEGQDEQCTDLRSGNTMPEITFNIDGNVATS